MKSSGMFERDGSWIISVATIVNPDAAPIAERRTEARNFRSACLV